MTLQFTFLLVQRLGSNAFTGSTPEIWSHVRLKKSKNVGDEEAQNELKDNVEIPCSTYHACCDRHGNGTFPVPCMIEFIRFRSYSDYAFRALELLTSPCLYDMKLVIFRGSDPRSGGRGVLIIGLEAVITFESKFIEQPYCEPSVSSWCQTD
ncbi:hypothetical protein J6590_070308 [Homalodisca vitripennis]|nr:hypothetical protein J6590_070308 [Homalodisca vitripennis]